MNKKYYTDPPKIWSIVLWCIVCLFAGLCVFMTPAKEGLEAIKWLYLIIIIGFDLMYIRWYWNYPIISSMSLEIKNLLFLSRTYRYCDIEHIDLICINSRGTVLAVKLKNKHFRKSVYISCVAVEQLDSLSVELSEKGVLVHRPK